MITQGNPAIVISGPFIIVVRCGIPVIAAAGVIAVSGCLIKKYMRAGNRCIGGITMRACTLFLCVGNGAPDVVHMRCGITDVAFRAPPGAGISIVVDPGAVRVVFLVRIIISA